MYDMANPVTVKGAVKRFEWTNPHAFIFLDVKDEKAGSVEWEIELMSLNHLRSYGWMRTTVKAGDMISATGGAAKSGATSMISAVIELPDGRKIRQVSGGRMLPHRDPHSRLRDRRRALSAAVAPLSRATTAAAPARSRRSVPLGMRGRSAARPHHVVHGRTASIKPGESVTLKWAVENPPATRLAGGSRARFVGE
jgi:hypothetical protein